ncbi:MAG: glutaredoxin [Lachnospiraceae bacterium]|nr:glutaredoxin [Lachnospiraceae bacterium]
MLKVYGSAMCPDCRACKANFEADGIEFEFIDINENLHNLAEFLKLRDTEPVFDNGKRLVISEFLELSEKTARSLQTGKPI